MQTVLGQGGGESGPRYYVVSSPLGDMLVPAVLNSFYRFTGLAASANGLVSILGEDISVLPGAIKSIAIPLPPAFLVNNITPPTLTGATFQYLDSGLNLQPVLEITGTDLALTNPYQQAVRSEATPRI